MAGPPPTAGPASREACGSSSERRPRAGAASRSLGRVDVRRQCLLRDLDERGERGGVVHGQLGQDLAVDLDVRGLQTLDEAVVRDAVGAGSGVDALDPQLTEVALALLAVVVVVDQRVGDLLLGLAVQARTLTAVAGGLLEDRPALLVGVDCPLDACHFLTPCSGAAVGLTRPGNDWVPVLTFGAPCGRRRRHLPRSFLIFLASPGAISALPVRRRVRRDDLCSSRWRLPARSRSTLPEPVTLKRLLAPLCDLFFGIAPFSPRRWRSGARS